MNEVPPQSRIAFVTQILMWIQALVFIAGVALLIWLGVSMEREDPVLRGAAALAAIISLVPLVAGVGGIAAAVAFRHWRTTGGRVFVLVYQVLLLLVAIVMAAATPQLVTLWAGVGFIPVFVIVVLVSAAGRTHFSGSTRPKRTE